jgi:hydroxyacylglutathione hydrolase
MLTVELVACLSDNYAYLLHDDVTGAVGIVDPSEAEPVRAALAKRGLRLTHIFNTHHHFDHTGGNLDLKAEFGARVIGPKADEERIPGIDDAIAHNGIISFGNHKAKVLDIPGHTKGHIAIWFEADNIVFTGDTLFAMGCGRMFEGTPPMMFTSLMILADLPAETKVYCGHEYTESNARFAVHIEPDNQAMAQRLVDVTAIRAQGLPTIPTTIGLERLTNPFLTAKSADDFGARRLAKDNFKG